MSRRLRNEFFDESDDLDYRASYRNYNDRKRSRSVDLESPRGRSKIRTRRDKKQYDEN